MISDDAKSDISGRSTTLFERLNTNNNLKEGSCDADPHDILESWEKYLGGKDNFNTRIEYLGFDMDYIFNKAHRNYAPPSSRIYEEFEPFWEIIDRIDDESKLLTDCYRFINNQPIPFEDIIAPFVRYARPFIIEEIQKTPNISTAAQTSVERYLLQRLSDVGSRAFHMCYKRLTDSSLKTLCNESEPTDKYEQFCSLWLKKYMLEFFKDYPVLARKFNQIIRGWANSFNLFLKRYRKDRQEIKEELSIFNIGVDNIKPGLSDPHAGQQTVYEVLLESNDKIIYKPRPITGQKMIEKSIKYINDNIDINLYVPKYVSGDGYGWMEFISHRKIARSKQLQRYFERCGILTCVLYLLCLKDCHFENVIAKGSNPVLIDAETIFHPAIDQTHSVEKDGYGTDLTSRKLIRDSIVGMGFIPLRGSMSAPKQGLSEATTIYRDWTSPIWKDVNTEKMSVDYDNPEQKISRNVPYAGNKIHEYKDSLIDGFSKGYLTIKENKIHKKIKKSSDGKKCETRVILRPTDWYLQVREGLRSPNKLKSGLFSTLYIEQLFGKFIENREGNLDKIKNIYRYEHDRLLYDEVPRFITYPKCTTIYTGTGRPIIKKGIEKRGYGIFQERVQNWSEDDLQEQIQLIKKSITEYNIGTKSKGVNQ